MDLRAWLASGKRPPATAPASPSPSKQAKPNAPSEQRPLSKDKAKDLLAMEEFRDQPLEVREEKIYCRACKASILCKAHLVRQHGSVQQGKGRFVNREKKSPFIRAIHKFSCQHHAPFIGTIHRIGQNRGKNLHNFHKPILNF
jgi:hypothetical protein